MNVAPRLLRLRLFAWSGLVVATALAAGFVWLLKDQGEAVAAAARAAEAQREVQGPVRLDERLAEQRKANAELTDSIDRLRNATGFTVGADFLVPPNHQQPGQFFNERLLAVQDRLRGKARDRSIVYQERLGFERVVAVPKAEDAPYLLTMLMLTEKAASALIETPGDLRPVERFAITQPTKEPQLTGPAGRPPLLREYPLAISVRATLPTLLWILHRLAQDEGDNDYPLIVRKLEISSPNQESKDAVKALDAVIEVAGMRFLDLAERATGPTPTAKAKSGLGGGK
jgi:hypothetical protein